MNLRSAHSFRVEAIVFPTILVVIWEVVVRLQMVPPSQSAAPSEVLVTFLRLVTTGNLLKHALCSLARLTIGVFFGALLGIVTGVTLASLKKWNRTFTPTLQFLAGVPVVLWMPFCVMFFGTEEAFKVSLAAICTFFLMSVLTLQAVKLIEKQYVELALIYERTYWEKVRELYLPSCTPSIFAALRLSFVIAWIVLFFVEYASATPGKEGLGWFIADARSVGRIEEEFAGLFFLGLLAFLLDRLVAKVQKKLLSWSDTFETVLLIGKE